HEHVYVGRYLDTQLAAAVAGGRALQPIRTFVVAHERELRAVEREPVDSGRAPAYERAQQLERRETDAGAARREERRAVADRANADVAERELGAAPTPRRLVAGVLEIELELGRDPRLQLALVARQLAHEQPPAADRDDGEHAGADQRDDGQLQQFARPAHELHQ